MDHRHYYWYTFQITEFGDLYVTMVELASGDVGDGFSETNNMHIEDVVAMVRENLVSGGLISEPLAAALGKIHNQCKVGMTCPSQNAFLIFFLSDRILPLHSG